MVDSGFLLSIHISNTSDEDLCNFKAELRTVNQSMVVATYTCYFSNTNKLDDNDKMFINS